MSAFTSLWDLLTNGLSTIVDVVQYATTYITAIPRGIATFTYYINNMPPFASPFLMIILTVCVVRTIFSLV